MVDASVGRVAAALFGLASRVRGRRSLHPDGVGFEATLTIEPAGSLGSRLLDTPGEHRCIVRLSRAIGLPERSRDILGLAVRVLDGERNTVQDLLFSSVAGDGRLARHLLTPVRRFAGPPLSTILPYRTPHATLTLLLRGRSTEPERTATLEETGRAFTDQALVFALEARTQGTVTGLGHLRAHHPLTQKDTEALRFNPYHASADLQPAGLINALRRRAYAASQRGRAAARPEVGQEPADADGRSSTPSSIAASRSSTPPSSS